MAELFVNLEEFIKAFYIDFRAYNAPPLKAILLSIVKLLI